MDFAHNFALLPCLDYPGGRIVFPRKSQQVFYDDDLKLLTGEAVERTPGFWLLRAESGVAGILPVGCTIYRNGMPIGGFAVLHEEDRITVGPRSLRFREIGPEGLAPIFDLVAQRCGLCGSEFANDSKVRQCPLCGRGYCVACWGNRKMHRCCSPYCRFAPAALFDRRD